MKQPKKKLSPLTKGIIAMVFLGACWIAYDNTTKVFGNPFTRAQYTSIAKEYVQEKYPDYTYEGTNYNGKFDEYNVRFEKKGSQDEEFIVTVKDGRVLSDTYQSAVEDKGNLQIRIMADYQDMLAKTLDSICPYKQGQFAGASISFVLNEQDQNSDKPMVHYDNQLDPASLNQNEEVDLNAIGNEYGILSFYFLSSKISEQELLNYVHMVKDALAKENIPYQYVNLFIQNGQLGTGFESMGVNAIDKETLMSDHLDSWIQEHLEHSKG